MQYQLWYRPKALDSEPIFFEFFLKFYFWGNTLESGIDVGQGITVGPGKYVKKNKCRAFNKAVGPGKKSKINKRRAYVYSGL